MNVEKRNREAAIAAPEDRGRANIQDMATNPSTSTSDKRCSPDHDRKNENMSTGRVVAIWLSTVCGIMCTFLDEGIIATAIPQITDEFGSLGDVGVRLSFTCRSRCTGIINEGADGVTIQWYGSAYLLTLCSFQLVYGRLYSQFNIRMIYLASLAIFEAGSLTCALSPSSTVFIIGRAMCGCGGSGLMSGTIALFSAVLPASRLPLYIGAVGIVYGLAAAFGPVIGGLITNSYLTWRW